MANMQLSQSDKEMLLSYSRQLLARRKQLAVLNLKIDEVEQLYLPRYFYHTIKKLAERDPSNERFYNRSTAQQVRYDSFLGDKPLRIFLRCNRQNKMIATYTSDYDPRIQMDSPYLSEFRRWCIEALKVETANQVTAYVVNRVISDATTYKQMFKALPESMKAVAAHSETRDRDWAYRSQRTKLKEVLAENNRDGAGRARSLPDETVALLDRRRSTVEEVLAMSVLLPDHDGQLEHSVFDQTWVTSFSIDTAKL